MARRHFIYIYFLLFFASGFSGLIYESIWSHYLKLFLGHAASAQTLVLSIFMLGLALGGYLSSRFERRIPNLLLTYAVVELLVGFAALIFHSAYVGATSLAYDSVIPALGSPQVVELFKWTLGIFLILPQSILLGATFPLMASGIVRYYPDHNGWNLSILYFSNSFGAALGVLINGFVFIPNLGLPGALLTGGLINVLVALGVYLAVKSEKEESQSDEPSLPRQSSPLTFDLGFLSLRSLLLLTAAFTGTASFMYEIAWIRMLSLVFDSSTYSFEVMLSAFILGIALGGFWIRKRIDTFTNPLAVLGKIQLVMGTLAAFSLVLYMACFDLMVWTRSALSLTEQGYFLFMLINYGSSALVMLPVTICAGMTLPLITKILIEHENNTSSIGRVYATNTLGSIIGVVVASQLVMPLLGLKPLVLGGALIDLALGCLLLYATYGAARKYTINIVPALTVWAVIALAFSLDQLTMASGPFRSGRLLDEGSSQVLFYQDGKSSTVSVVQHDNGLRAIANNGKPDAGLYVPDADGRMPPSANDEHTMMLLPILGLAHKPDTSLVANVGFGSGLTAHTMLGAPVDRVDSTEIEPAIIEGARFFEGRVARAYNDPRSNIIIGDAKTLLVSNGELYDLIIAEPSNPWVSGVANLFSDEYYSLTKRYLTEGGIFLQWLQLYEIEERLVASIYKALRNNFEQVIFYQVSLTDTVLVASNSGNLDRPLNFEQFAGSPMEAELRRIQINSVDDLLYRRLADQDLLDILFDIESVTANSDYFPLVDSVTPMNMFTRTNSLGLLDLHRTYFIGNKSLQANYLDNSRLTPTPYIESLTARLSTHNLVQAIVARDPSLTQNAEIYQSAARILSVLEACSAGESIAAPVGNLLVELLLPRLRDLDFADSQRLLAPFTAASCLPMFTAESQAQLEIAQAYADQDFDTLLNRIANRYSNTAIPQSALNQTLLAWAYIAAIETGRFSDLVNIGLVYDIPAEQLPRELELLGSQFQQRSLEAMLR